LEEKRDSRRPERQRQDSVTQRDRRIFSGIGLYDLSLFSDRSAGFKNCRLKAIAKVPFEIDPMIHIAWLIGFIPY